MSTFTKARGWLAGQSHGSFAGSLDRGYMTSDAKRGSVLLVCFLATTLAFGIPHNVGAQEPGDSVRALLLGARRMAGTFQAWNDSTLVLRDTAVLRSDLVGLEVWHSRSWPGTLALFSLVGAASGVLYTPETKDDLAYVVGGAAIGLVFGVISRLLQPGTWRGEFIDMRD